MNKIIHYEDLWVMSEKASLPQFKETDEIINKAISMLEDFKSIHKISVDHLSSSAVGKELKNKTFGRLLFYLTALSSKENIDVYSVLKYELDLLKVKDKVQNVNIDDELELVSDIDQSELRLD